METESSRRRRRKGRAGLVVVVVVVIGVVAAGLLIRGNDTAVEDGGGRVAPAISLPGLRDPTAAVALPPRRAAVVYFFASWCVPCRRELPVVDAAYRERTDVAFVAVAHMDHRDDAIEFLDRHGGSFPAGYDPGGDVALDYRLRGLPATVFVNQRGRIDAVVHGELDQSTLYDRIDALVGQSEDRR